MNNDVYKQLLFHNGLNKSRRPCIPLRIPTLRMHLAIKKHPLVMFLFRAQLFRLYNIAGLTIGFHF